MTKGINEMNRMRDKKGFTLIECVIAIMIILIVSGTALVVYRVALYSAASQWDDYQAVVQADNGLSYFQVSENFELFDKYFRPIVSGDGGMTHTETYQLAGGNFSQSDLSDQMIPMPFSAIRTYESGKVQFYGHSLDSDTEYSDPIAQFTYASDDLAAFRNDTAPLTELCDASAHYEEAGLIKLQYTLKGYNGNRNDYAIRIRYDYYDAAGKKVSAVQAHYEELKIDSKGAPIKDGEGNVTVTHTETCTATAFERYLLQNGYILTPFGYGWTGSTGNKLLCYVYQISEDGKSASVVKENGKDVYYMLDGSFKNYKDKWHESGASAVKVTVKKCNTTSSSSYSNHSNMSEDLGGGTKFTSFDWAFYPWVAFSVAWNGSNDSGAAAIMDIASKKGEGGLLYTDYQLKNGYASNLYYALSDGNTSISVYNNDETPVVLYQYTGKAIASNLNGFQSAGFSATKELEDGTTQYYKKMDLGKPDLVTFDDTEMEISFCKDNGTPIVRFRYKDAATYIDAKESITVENYDYGAYYKNVEGVWRIHYEAKTKDGNLFTRVNTILRQSEDGLFTLVDNLRYGEGSEAQTETTDIFSTYCDQVFLLIDGKETSITLNTVEVGGTIVNVTSVTKYYMYSNSAYGCLVRVTFANFAYDTATEPQYKAWIMKADKLKKITSEVIAGLADENEAVQFENIRSFEAGLGDPYIDYRKG